MKSRPSRFKYSINIEGVQNKDEVVNIISKMIGTLFTPSELNFFADELNGSTLDHIK